MSASGFPEVLAIADDATGALEVGGQFAAEGVPALVTLRSELSASSGALVVDTESRYMEPEQAALAVASLAAAARAAGVEHIFKKTDSTLRGNIAAELEALLDVFPERVLVYVPAYPKMNRVVCGGEVFVDGRPLTEASAVADPTKPAKSGSIPDLMRSRCRAEVLLVAGAEELASRLASAPAGSVVVCDGRSDADLAGAAGVLARTQRAYLVAGTGGFVGDWVRRLPVRRDFVPPAARHVARCLVASGSMHAASKEQVRSAAAAGLDVRYLDAQSDAAIARALAAGSRVAVATPGDSLSGVSSRIGRIVGETLRAHPADATVVFGGSTTLAILAALGVKDIWSLGELLPGVPMSVIHTGSRELLLVTKAGGFGGPGTLVSILERLGASS